MNKSIALLELGIEYKDRPGFEIALTSTKGLLNVIPVLGGVVASVLGDIQQARQLSRFSEYIESLLFDLNRRIEEIDTNKMSSDDFLDLFEQALRQAIKARSLQKRAAIRNLVSNFMCDPKASIDYTEYLLEVVCRLPTLHLRVITLLAVLPEKQWLTDDILESEYRKFCSELQISEDDLLEILTDLENEGISSSFKTQYQARGGPARLRQRCRLLIQE